MVQEVTYKVGKEILLTIEVYLRWILLVIVRDLTPFYGKIDWEQEGKWTGTFTDDHEEDFIIFYKSKRYPYLHKAWSPWKYWYMYMRAMWLIVKYEMGYWTIDELNKFMIEPLD